MVQSTALNVLGRACRQHQDWFDDNDVAISNFLIEENRLHKVYVIRLTDDNEAAFYRSCRLVQQRLREIQDEGIIHIPNPESRSVVSEILGSVLTFKEHLNAVFPDIRLTMEEEENNQLAFLDILVCSKDCGGLKAKVFRKVTNTTQILNFNSNNLFSHKRSCVRALHGRVETHCSEMEDKIAELQYLRRVLKANGYPRNSDNRCIRKRHQRPNPTGPKF
ncbi:hypothetical protein SprV_0401571700 [Sparganum proliferum]